MAGPDDTVMGASGRWAYTDTSGLCRELWLVIRRRPF